MMKSILAACCLVAVSVLNQQSAWAQKKADDDVAYPPRLPGGKQVVTLKSPKLLRPISELKPGVKVATAAPTVDFLYYPGQDYPGNPWSVWADGLAAGDVYYSAIGDHKSPEGNAFVHAYDSRTMKLRQVVDLRKLLARPAGHYTPGKIHSRLDLGNDGWLYFSTHRGSTRVALDPNNHYAGDWIVRYHPGDDKTEVVAHNPLPLQCMPTSVLDPERLIFYAGTADALNKKEPQFLAYDVRNRKVLYHDQYGPYRYLIFARSTGKVYFHGNTSSPGKSQGPRQLVRFDPEKPGTPTPIDAVVGLRSATQETADGFVYTIDRDELWRFDTKTETAESLGPIAVGAKDYTTSIDVDPSTGRYLYYVPGAHGGAEADGSPLVQYDVKTRTRKIVAFLHPALYDEFGYVTLGSFGSAVSPSGDKVYVTWNGNRGTSPEDLKKRVRFNTCALTVVHIPESERQP
jgi:DNA-binding beta-propeller fold protein YncE